MYDPNGGSIGDCSLAATGAYQISSLPYEAEGHSDDALGIGNGNTMDCQVEYNISGSYWFAFTDQSTIATAALSEATLGGTAMPTASPTASTRCRYSTQAVRAWATLPI